MRDVVTGEAVQLELPAATFASRAVSGALDLALAVALLIGTFIGLSRLAGALDGASGAALTLVVVVAITVGVPTLVETLTRGRTLGKLVMGLRTVRDDGGPIRFRQAFVRSLVLFVEVYVGTLGVPALISSLVSSRGKRLGDRAAGTYVVRERGGAGATPMVQSPPHLIGWAQAADLGRLPDGLALAVRGFLGRSSGMHPGARAAMGVELARAVSPHVAPPPPAGTGPEAFLAAVLAERRRPDLERLGHEPRLRERLAGVDSVDAALARVRAPDQPRT
ncbi:RDD family protein [Angustibacter aerolatus]